MSLTPLQQAKWLALQKKYPRLDPNEPDEIFDAAEAEADLYTFAKQAWRHFEGSEFIDGEHIRQICIHLQKFSEKKITNLAINIPPRHCKPVWDKSKVVLQSGERVSIDTVSVGDRVLTHTGKFQEVLGVHIQGELECIKITTHSGRELFTAPDHPFLTPESWVKACDLKLHQTLALVTPNNSTLLPDPVVAIEPIGMLPCRCLTVAEDSSFTIEDIAVHNSSLVSAIFPAWEWTHAPTEKYLSFSYAKDIALTDNWRARVLMQSEWYQKRWGSRWQFTSDMNLKGRYTNDKGGQRIANAMGAAMGQGGTRIVIDDPQSLDDALSRDARDKVIMFYDGALSLRNFGEATRRIIVMQRLHLEDLIGHVQDLAKRGLEDWTFLIFPIVFVESRACLTYEHPDGSIKNTPPYEGAPQFGGDWRTKEGQAIWPELYGCTREDDTLAREAIAKLERKTPESIWASQALQHPVPPGGSIFKSYQWFPQYTQLPSEVIWGKPTIFTSWDCAVKDKEVNDPTAAFILAYYPHKGEGEYYVLHRVYMRKQFVGQEEAMKEIVRMVPQALAHVVESGGNGSALVSACNEWVPTIYAEMGIQLPYSARGGTVELFQPWHSRGMSKQGRASITSPHFKNMRVFWPSWVDWYDECVKEFLGFPFEKHDDMVDAMTQAILWCETDGKNILLGDGGDFKLGRPDMSDLYGLGDAFTRDLDIVRPPWG